jgi:hypothetical protein
LRLERSGTADTQLGKLYADEPSFIADLIGRTHEIEIPWNEPVTVPAA